MSVFPSYAKLLAAKSRCYPQKEDIEITEKKARVKLQAVLDLTVQRIMQIPSVTIDSSETDWKLVSKWGFDGSSSQSNYKQKSQGIDFDDSSVFMTSLVPLRLVSNNFTVWENPRPSSTHYCRPVKFEFIKETTDHIKQEESAIKEEIANLIATKYGDINISHELHMTMIDGKIATVLTDTPSSSTCNLCLAKPKEMNNLEHIFSRPLREDFYRYGLSSLHMWIRCMECLLHIFYNLDFEMWSARDVNKQLKKARKESTQAEFRAQTGMLIDIVKQGFGTTNDGNTTRRFFRDFEKTASIIKVDEELIKRFAVILQVISSGKPVNIDNFKRYCRETAELYVHLYPWYYMPASVHKLLIHGADICKHFSVLPIGILSEEASEARNKDFRNIRERHTRKRGRIETNEDLLHNFLITSDPYISHIRPTFSNSVHHELLPEALELLIYPERSLEYEEEVIPIDKENNPDPLC